MRNGSVNLSLVGDVAYGCDRVRAAARRGLFQRSGIEIKQRDSVVDRQPSGGRKSDPASTSADQRDRLGHSS